MKRVMSDGVLTFPCPKCDKLLEVGLHVVQVAADPNRKSAITGTHYQHRVEFVAEAPHLHAEFWGHMVRCHQPNPHPYMGVAERTEKQMSKPNEADCAPSACQCNCHKPGMGIVTAHLVACCNQPPAPIERFGLSLTPADFDELGAALDRITEAEQRAERTENQ